MRNAAAALTTVVALILGTFVGTCVTHGAAVPALIGLAAGAALAAGAVGAGRALRRH